MTQYIKTVNFGSDSTGLFTVGYSLINSDGSIELSRTTSGVFEIQTNCGIYAASISLEDPSWQGIILWDDGQDEPLYASEEIFIDNTDTTSILETVISIDNKSDTIINTTNDIDTKVDILNIDCTSLNDKIDIIDNKIDTLSIDTTTVDSKIDILNETCNEISTDLKRALGLIHENIFIDLPSYDDNSNLISARVRIYSNSSSVGTNNDIIGNYLIESDSIGAGKFSTWRQVKI